MSYSSTKTMSQATKPSSSSSSPLARFLLYSPKSIRNFSLILGFCLAFDHLIANNQTAYNFVNDGFYKSYIKPWASHAMFEPQIAVLSFMVACTIFVIAKFFKNNKNVNDNVIQVREGSLTPEEEQEYKDRLLLAAAAEKKKNSETRNNDTTTGSGTISSLVSKVIAGGDITSWAFWAISNVGLYLGLIDIFQRVTQYGDTLYRVNQDWHGSPTEMFTLTRIFLEVFVSTLGYDLLFSLVHRSFHSTAMPQWWQKLHLTHHDHYQNVDKPLHVMVTFHHHMLDATIQIMINAGLQQIVTLSWMETAVFGGDILPRHTMSKMLHNIFVTYLLVESHSGQDWAFMTHRWLFPEWFRGGATAHQRHHTTGKAPYHQFFTVLDDF